MRALLPLLLSGALAPAFVLPGMAATCADGAVFSVLDEALPAVPDESIDVADVQSTEGGAWDVYLSADGQGAAHIVRIDFGEGGRWSARLSVASPGDSAVATTHFIYSAPYYVPASTTIREEKDIFVFCDGALLLPGEDFGHSDEYVARAAEALRIFDAGEIAAYMPTLKRR